MTKIGITRVGPSMNKKILVFIMLVASIMVWYFVAQKKGAWVDVIVVGTNAEYPPFTFIKNDKIVGFDIDLILEVGKRLGKKIEFKDMPFDVLIPEMQRGSIHVIAAGMTPKPAREKEVMFTQCYFTDDPLVIVAKANKNITTIEQLNQKTVIVNDGYTADYYMSSLKGPILIRLPNPASAFLALNSERADAYVTARSTVSWFLKGDEKQNFTTTPIPGTEERYAFVVSPKAPTRLLPLINKIIEDIKQDGTLRKIKDKWGIE
jgi:polar amino acid transport system substrate-binding protein